MTQENGKSKDDKAEDEASKAPEVEAEIVDEEGAGLSSPSAFDEASPEIEEALAGAEEELAPKKSTLTPGVILFLAFTVVALAAFYIWWRQSGDEAPQPQNAVEEAAPQTDAPQTQPEEPAPASDDGALAEEPSGEEPAPALPEPSGKIENQPTGELSPPAETVTPSDTFLPPVSERGAEKIANTIDTGALEAVRRAQEAEDAVIETEDQQADDTAEFDVGPGENNASDPQTSESAPEPESEEPLEAANAGDAIDQLERTDQATEDAATPQSAGVEVSAKILNDLEDLRNETAQLENALSEERQRNADLAAEISELRQGFEAALAARDERYADEMTDMRASLQKIQNSEIQGATDQLRANLALDALRRKVEAGAPFAGELTAMAEFAPQTASALAPFAHSGAPTADVLRESFGAAARKGLAAAGRAEAGDGWKGVVARAKNLVSVRPAAPQAGDSPKAVISRAERAVSEGDLTYALSELDKLPAPAKDAMADWISDAQAQAEAQSVLRTLSQQINGDSSE